MELVKFPSSPIAFDGWGIILAGISFAAGCWIGLRTMNPDPHSLPWALWMSGLSLALFFTAFSIWFFRDPERTPLSQNPSDVISSADGTVLKVESVNDPRYGAPAEKISIFMSPLNVHVNRAPIQGKVTKVEYVAGKFFAANLDKASTDNERNWVTLQNAKGQQVAFLQIAGFIARRIVCRTHVGDQLDVGQRYGMIRFGSRMEIFLPKGSRIEVKPGDKIQAGETVVGKLPNA
jgi:phosphatidylserine decarboxylase